MRIRPGVMWAAAGTLWAATLTGAFTGFDSHPQFTPLDFRIWLCVVSAALLATWAAVQSYLIDRASRAAEDMTKAALTRPFDHGTGPIAKIMDTGPMRKLTGVSPQRGRVTGPLVPLGARRKQHGRHSTAR